MHDGSSLRMRKLEEDYDPTDKIQALTRLAQSQEVDEVLTGVLYLNTQAPNFIEILNMSDEPLANLPESVTRPSREVLEDCMEELR
jgi:2-oxoglutarate ferredoxin oxidoreductase subunit beta